MEKKEKEVENKKCYECGSGQTYVRIKNGAVVCRNCGYVEEKNNGS